MMRSLRLAGFAALIVLGCSWPAQAGLLDILEELSGPGPFGRKVGRNLLFSGFCQPPGDKEHPELTHKVPLLGIPNDISVTRKNPVTGGDEVIRTVPIPAEMPCFYADVRSLLAPRDDNFPRRVSAFVIDGGLTFPIVKPFEIGVGFGAVRFHTDDLSTYRFMVTPLRFVAKPLLFIPKYRNSRKLDFLKYYIKETVIIGRLRGEHFGVSNDVFDNKSWRDFVTSGGLVVDVFELFD
jgi:hypothetical protein